MTSLFMISTLVLLWPWIGYPAVAWAIAKLRPRPTFGSPITPSEVSVVIAARDEGAHLDEKLASLRAGGLPEEAVEIIVVDDGSQDDTAWIANAHGATLLSSPTPRGKAAALNAGVAAAKHSIVVLTDARQPLVEGSLAALARRFSDPRVGAVSGELSGAARGAGAVYRKLDDALRRHEAASGSTVGVTGSLWACRRSLFPLLPEGTILDDVLAPMSIARGGRRVVVEPEARVIERDSHRVPAVERRRRMRTLAGNVQLVARAPWLLAPIVNPLWGRFVQHKLLRLFGPFALVGSALSLAVLASSGGIWLAAAAAALLGGTLALLGRRAGVVGMLARGFLEAQLLCALAWRAALAGRALALWRPNEPAPSISVPSRRGHG